MFLTNGCEYFDEDEDNFYDSTKEDLSKPIDPSVVEMGGEMGSITGFLTLTPEQEKKVCEFLNDSSTTVQVLQSNVGLTSTQAKNIIAHRDGPDAVYGTADDNPFDSVKELDDVYGIGDASITKINNYAATWTKPDPTALYKKVYEFLNHKSTTAAVLDDNVGLTPEQANNIIAHRNGADGILGTSDDNLFDSIEELDAVPLIDSAEIEKIKAFASSWVAPAEPDKTDEKTLQFLNHKTTTVDVLQKNVGLTSTQANNIINHRNGPDATFGTSDDDPFDSIAELDAVPYVGTATITKIKTYASTWTPPTDPDQPPVPPPDTVPFTDIFMGDKSEYDQGPAKGSGWALLFSQVPNYRQISRDLGKVWMAVDPVTGKSKFQTVNEALVAAAKDPIKEYTLTGDKFRYTMGPPFYRGRLDNTIRVLVMGQEGATDEALVHRAFIGGTGQKVQSFLNSIGITKSYICINTFVYSIFEQYDQFTTELAESGPIKDHRNQLIEKVYNEANLRLILTFGNAAKRSIEIWRDEVHGGKLPANVKWAHMLHPGMAATAYDPGGTSPTDPTIIAAVVNSFTLAWKKVWMWKAADKTWLASDSDGWKYQQKKYYYMNFSIPYRDLPYGVSKFIGHGGTATERDSSGLRVQFHSPNGVRYGAPVVPFPSTVSKVNSGFEKTLANELPWEPPKADPDNQHDPGPGKEWSNFFLETPAQADVLLEANVAIVNDFVDPVWYRGRISGKPWVLIVAQNWDIDSFIAGRTLSGDDGQRINNFLKNIGTDLNYVMITPYPFLLNKATVDEHTALTMAMTPKLTSYRNQIFEKILLASDIKLVLLFGEIAQEAFSPMLANFKGTVINIAHPRDAGAYTDWNDKMLQLKNLAVQFGLNGKFTAYTSSSFTNARTAIPRQDIIYGRPLWMGTSGDISQQADPSWLFWNAPKWIKYEPFVY
jgi:DNA uptake protein ComE-like DNA-binding protein/uracil-DNA glycosylase